jgi:hypothetical protein
VRILESIVELLGCLVSSALTLMIGSCVVGSIVPALRAVIREAKKRNQEKPKGRPIQPGRLSYFAGLNASRSVSDISSVSRKPRTHPVLE